MDLSELEKRLGFRVVVNTSLVPDQWALVAEHSDGSLSVATTTASIKLTAFNRRQLATAVGRALRQKDQANG